MAFAEKILPKETTKTFAEKLKQEWDSERPKIRDLKDLTYPDGKRVYRTDEIERDRAKLKRLHERFATKSAFSQARRYGASAESIEAQSSRAEYLLMELLYNYADYDGEVSITPASKFDDFFNGVDFVMALEDENSRHGYEMLAVDVTIAEDIETIIEKEDKITNEILEGYLTRVKYLQLEADEDIQGKFRMPKVVLAFPRQTTIQMQDLLQKERDKTSTPEDKKKLKRYSEIIKNEFIQQLEKYIAFIKEWEQDINPKSYAIMLKHYNKVLDRIKK